MKIILIALIAIISFINASTSIYVYAQGEPKNAKTVRTIYSAFFKGDVQPLLNNLAKEYTVKTVSAAQFDSSVADFSNNALGFVQAIPFKFEELNITDLTWNKNQVTAILKIKVKFHSTGKEDTTYVSNTWTFDTKGKIISFLQIEDTADMLDLLQFGETQYNLARLFTENIKNSNTKDIDKAYSQYAPDAIYWSNGVKQTFEENKQGFAALHASFPDLHLEIYSITPGWDRVASRVIATGTFTGAPFMGHPPTGKKFTSSLSFTETYKNGKVIEENLDYDVYSFLAQLGFFDA